MKKFTDDKKSAKIRVGLYQKTACDKNSGCNKKSYIKGCL